MGVKMVRLAVLKDSPYGLDAETGLHRVGLALRRRVLAVKFHGGHLEQESTRQRLR